MLDTPDPSNSTSNPTVLGVAQSNGAVLTPDQIGVTFGSALGNLLANGNSLAAIPLSTALGITLGSLVTIIENAKASGDISKLISQALSQVPDEVLSTGASAVTSYLTAQVLDAVGVKGFAAQAIGTASNITIGKIAANLATGQDPFSKIDSASNLDFAIGSFIGNEIGAAILPATTQEEQLGGSLGSAVTAIVASELLINPATSTFLSIGIPGIGALVGYVIGNEIGALIGGTPSPQAWATVYADPLGANGITFHAGGFEDKDHGPRDLIDTFGTATANALNGVVADIGGMVRNPGAVGPQIIGMRRGAVSYHTPGLGNDYHFDTLGQMQAFTVATALNQMLNGGGIVGGDVYIKRAVENFVTNALTNQGYNPFAHGQNANPLIAGDLSALTGDISIAKSYEQYLQNPDLINALIETSPDSDFAAGWLVTLQAADQLGLNRRATCDWTGRWSGFLAGNNADAEQVTIAYSGDARGLTVNGTAIADTIDTAGKDSITDTTANDTISIDENGTLAANGNVLFNGTAATTPQTSAIAAVIDVGPGNAVVYAGGQGDDVIGDTMAGFGNELLVAGSADGTQSQNATWLLAGSGDDTLVGGASGGDVLVGGAGSDVLQAGSGAAMLVSGSGSGTATPSLYTLNGSGQGDILVAGVGVTVINEPGGDDTVVYRQGDGQVVINGITGQNSELSFGPGLDWSTLHFAQDGNNLVITDNTSVDQITIVNWLAGAGNGFYNPDRLQYFRFDDGTKIRIGDFNVQFGNAANGNNLVGVYGQNLLVAGANMPGLIDGWIANNSVYLGSATGDDSIDGDQGPGVDTLIGDGGDDTLAGGIKVNGGADYIQGGKGNDLLVGGLGSSGDTLDGGTGSATIIGSGGNDVIEYHRGDGAHTLLNPLSLSTATLIANGAGWLDGLGWQTIGTGASSYNVVTNGQLTVIDSRDFATTTYGIQGYTAYDRSSLDLYYWTPAQEVSQAAGAGSSVIAFGADITAANLIFARSGDNLEIGVRADGDLSTGLASLTDVQTLVGYFAPDGSGGTLGSPIKSLVFQNGSSLALSAIVVGNTDQAERVTGDADQQIVYGGAGNDTLSAGAGRETVVGGGGDNVLVASTGNDQLIAGNGDDTFYAGTGSDTFSGGGGKNTVSFAELTGPVQVSLADPASSINGDVFTNIDAIVGTGYGDTLIGGNTNTNFDGGASTATNVVTTFVGGTGDNIYHLHNADAVITDAGGANEIYLDDGMQLSDLYFSEIANTNTLSIEYAPNTSRQSDDATYLINDFFASPGVDGGSGSIADIVQGTRSAPLSGLVLNGTATGSDNALVVGNVLSNGAAISLNVLTANSGNDLLIGGSGNDTFVGGSGNDTFEGGTGSSLFETGTGTGTVSFADRETSVRVDLSVGEAWDGSGQVDTLEGITGIVGGAGNDTISAGSASAMIQAGSGSALVWGGFANDTLIGGIGADTIHAGRGNDLIEAIDSGDTSTIRHYLFGGDGQDTIYGGNTTGDVITTGDGAALVYGSLGLDTITGGAGSDTITAGTAGALVLAGAGQALITGGSGANAINTLVAGSGTDTLIAGGSGAQNQLVGGSGLDTFVNNVGNATMIGGVGSAIFSVDAASGITTLHAPSSGASDLVLTDAALGSGLTPGQVWLAQSGADLLISVIGATAQVRIEGFFAQAVETIDRIVVGNSVLLLSQAITPVNAAVGTIPQLMQNLLTQDSVAIPLDGRGVPTSMPPSVTDLLGEFWSTSSAPGADTLTASAGSQVITGSQSSNLIVGAAAGGDTLIAGIGNDTLISAGADNLLIGGAGNDLIEPNGDGDVVLNGSGQATIIGGANATSNLWLDGGTGATSIAGGPGYNVILAGNGTALVQGDGGQPDLYGDGSDTLIAGTGDQTLIGGNATLPGYANVFLSGNGADSLVGNGLSNLFIIDGFGPTTVVGSTVAGATNTISYALATMPIWTDIADGYGIGVGINGFENSLAAGNQLDNVQSEIASPFGGAYGLTGGDFKFSEVEANASVSSFINGKGTNWLLTGTTSEPSAPVSLGADTVQVTNGYNTIVASNNGDLLEGGAGSDQIYGGLGADTMVAGTGTELLVGGSTEDTFEFGGVFGNDTVIAYQQMATHSVLDFSKDDIVQYNQLWFTQFGNNLIIELIGMPGSITVENYFANGNAGTNQSINVFEAHGARPLLKAVNVVGLIQLMSGFSKPANLSDLETLEATTVPYKGQMLLFSTIQDIEWNQTDKPTIRLVGNAPAAYPGNGTISFVVQTADQYDPSANPAGYAPSVLASDGIALTPTITPSGNNDGTYLVTVPNVQRTYGTDDLTFQVTNNAGVSASTPLIVPLTWTPVALPPTITSGVGTQTISVGGATYLLSFGLTSNNDTPQAQLDQEVTITFAPLPGLPEPTLQIVNFTDGPSGISFNLANDPNSDGHLSGGVAVTVTAHDTVEGSTGNILDKPASKTFDVLLKAIDLPEFSGLPQSLTWGANGSASATFTVSDYNPQITPAVSLNLSGLPSWMSAAIAPVAGIADEYTLTVWSSQNESNQTTGVTANLIIHADDGTISQDPVVALQVLPVDQPKNLPTQSTLNVTEFNPVDTPINPGATIQVLNDIDNGPDALADGFNNLHFIYGTSLYYKNGIAVLQTASDITVVQANPNSTDLYVYLNAPPDRASFDQVVTPVYGYDAAGQYIGADVVTVNVADSWSQMPPINVTTVYNNDGTISYTSYQISVTDPRENDPRNYADFTLEVQTNFNGVAADTYIPVFSGQTITLDADPYSSGAGGWTVTLLDGLYAPEQTAYLSNNLSYDILPSNEGGNGGEGNGGDGGGSDPLVIDLPGTGTLDLTSLGTSKAIIPTTNGAANETSWVGADDGILAYLADGNGTVDTIDDLNFLAGQPNAASNSQSWSAFDTDGNGVLDPGDAAWKNFRIWRDLNGDGIAQSNELETLDQAGIAQISMAATPTTQTVNGNTITATSTVTLTNGQMRLLAYVTPTTKAIAVPAGDTPLLGTEGVADTLTGGAENDVFDGRAAPTGGTKTESGGGGADIYLYTQGYGGLVINNGSTTDAGAHGTLAIQAPSSIVSEIWFERTGNDLSIIIADNTTNSDTITVQNWYAAASNRLASINLSDGTTISAANIDKLRQVMDVSRGATPGFVPGSAALDANVQRAESLYWQASADTQDNTTSVNISGGVLVGDGQNDTFTPNAVTTIFGGAGNNSYAVSEGEGQLTLYNGRNQAGAAVKTDASGSIAFGSGFAPTNLWFDRTDGTSGEPSSTGSDLQIDLLGTNQTITVKDWFTAGDSFAELLKVTVADIPGLALSTAGVATLVQASANFEATYQQANGGTAFDPHATINGSITDPKMLSVVNTVWQT